MSNLHACLKALLGYKALMLCWSNGRTQFMLDFSLHGEKEKVEGKEQGLTAAQKERRYECGRDKDSHVASCLQKPLSPGLRPKRR